MSLANKQKFQIGFSTLEILIAFTVIIVSISASVVLVFSSQSFLGDSEFAISGVFLGQDVIADQTVTAKEHFGLLGESSSTPLEKYSEHTTLDMSLVTQCQRVLQSTVSWEREYNRSDHIALDSVFQDYTTARRLGGNCDVSPPLGNWQQPVRFAGESLVAAKANALDVYDKIVYVAGTSTPYLFIADTSHAVSGQTGGLFVHFTNGFFDDAPLNDIVIARLSDGRLYALLARDTKTEQFEIVDVSDMFNPVSVAKKTLLGVSSSGSYPQGFRLSYFDNKVYITTRFTAGPELHIFDVSHPASPVEVGSGTKITRTVEDLVVTRQDVAGAFHTIVFMASDKNTAPLSIYDVTNPTHVTELVSAEPIFSHYQDGQSVFIVGNSLYFGRSSDPSGPDLFMYDTSNPLSGAPLLLLGKQDIGTGVLGVASSGNYSFLITAKAHSEFQVWGLGLVAGNKINTTPFEVSGVVPQGIKYEDNRVYVISQLAESLKIISVQ